MIFGHTDSSDANKEAEKMSNQECVDMMSDRTFVDNAEVEDRSFCYRWRSIRALPIHFALLT